MTDIIQLEQIKTKIYDIRGQKIILDRDLAEIYQVETAQLNRAVKRNQARFPDTFMFQLTKDEFDLICQNGMSSWGGVRRPPYAFTEHGVLQASNVLRSNIAIQIGQTIIEIFVELRKQILANPSYELLKENMRRLEAEVKEVKATQLVESNLMTGKVTKLSQQVQALTDVLDEFQDNNLVIKRPEGGLDQDRLN